MPKLKKSSNKKFTVVVFYGAPAVGKFTVAKELHKQTGYKFFHNHHVYDLAHSLFDRETLNISRLYENIYFTTIKEIADAKLNAVTTHAFSAKYVSRTGLTDQEYMKKIQKIVEKAGGTTIFIHLKTSEGVLLKRVVGNSRKKFLKLKDPEILKDILHDKNKDWENTAKVKNNIVIDNTKLSPKKVVDLIVKHFKI